MRRIVIAASLALLATLAAAQEVTPSFGIDPSGTLRDLSVRDPTLPGFVPFGILDTATHSFVTATTPVEAYGAKGDANGTTGVGTDDTAAIEACMVGGRVCSLRPGATYRVTSRIDVPGNAGIVGTTNGANATIYCDPAGFSNTDTSAGARYGTNAVCIAAQGGLTAPFTPLDRVTFSNFKLDLGGVDGGRIVRGIVVRNAKQADIRGIEVFDGPSGTAIETMSVTERTTIVDNNIHDFFSELYAPFGIAIDSDAVNNVCSTNFQISRNRIVGLMVGATGFASAGWQADAIDALCVTPIANYRITDNYISKTGKGITPFAGGGVISNNTIDRCFNFCIALEHGANNIAVADNSITNVGRQGILLGVDTTLPTTGNTITGNTIVDVGVDAWTGSVATGWLAANGVSASCILVYPDAGAAGAAMDNIIAQNHCRPGVKGSYAFTDAGTRSNYWLDNSGDPGTVGFLNFTNTISRFSRASAEASAPWIDVASASNTAIWALEGNFANITGTATITTFGTGCRNGDWRLLKFADALTIARSAGLITPGNSKNILTGAGSLAFAFCDATATRLFYQSARAPGEIVASNIPAATAVSLTNGIGADCTSISLTPGDWQLTGTAGLVIQPTTTISRVAFSLSGTSASTDATNGRATGQIYPAAYAPGTAFNLMWPLPTVPVSPTTTTTYYLTAFVNFGVDTAKVFCNMHAVRIFN